MSAIGEFDVQPRMRAIVDNDFAGDPDDLFHLAHQLLSPSAELRLIVGSHLRPGDPFDTGSSAEDAVRRARELMRVMGMEDAAPVYEGAKTALLDPRRPIESAAAKAIVAEAMRGDTELPLYVLCGGGLTDLASALMMEPRIAERLTAVWIGGNEHPDLALPSPGARPVEYNLNIDVDAARFVFNESAVPLWQVPRNVYRQAMVSFSELEARVRPCGEVGAFLCGALAAVIRMEAGRGRNLGEAYVLGDSPLTLLTALQSPFQPDSSSSDYLARARPELRPDGSYGEGTGRGAMRVYTRIDTRLMFEDFFAKLRKFAD